MTRNDQILVACAQRTAVALEAIAVGVNESKDILEQIRVELKHKRFDDSEKENGDAKW